MSKAGRGMMTGRTGIIPNSVFAGATDTAGVEPSRASMSAAPLCYRPFGAFRLLLAALVMLQHFAANGAPAELGSLLRPYAPGSVAVLAFFLISGFVITEAAEQIYTGRPAAFATNRLLRIVPHFVLSAGLAIGVCMLFLGTGHLRLAHGVPLPGNAAFGARNVVANLLSFVPFLDRFKTYDFIEYGWAVRVEMVFYGGIAGCLGLGLWLRRCSFVRLLSLAGILAAPLFIAAMYGAAPPIFRYVPYFAFGVASYFAVRKPGWAGFRRAGVLMVLFYAAITWQLLSQGADLPIQATSRNLPAQFGIFVALTMLLLVLSKMSPRRMDVIDRHAGDMTYPLYLYHVPVLIVMLSLTRGYSYAAMFAGIVASIAAAYLAVRLVDPVAAQLRNRLRGRTLRHDRTVPGRRARGGSAVASGALTPARQALRRL